MFRKISTFGMALATTLSLTAIGCGGPADLEEGEVDDSIESKTDGPGRLRMGTYDVDIIPFWAMTLAADGTYSLRGGCRPGPTGPHCFAVIAENGSYTLTKSGSKRYLRLIRDVDGKLNHKFSYTVSGGDSEHVQLVEGNQTFTATLNEANKRQDGENCGGFAGLPCASNLVCQTVATCCDIPGTCRPMVN
jgi:hypothetical protein